MPNMYIEYDPSVPSSAPGAQGWLPLRGTKRGEMRIIDFYTEMLFEDRVFNVRAGTITTPLVGDVVITDTAAEMATSAAAANLTIMMARLNIDIRLHTGTLHEYAVKGVGAAHTAGTAFVAMPARVGATAVASSSSAVSAAGGVTVAAELATTTRRYWGYAHPLAAAAGSDPGAVAINSNSWTPRTPPTATGPACIYVQIAATGTGPSYYADYDIIELLTASIG